MISGNLWQSVGSTNFHDCVGATFPIRHERFASPLDVHATTRLYRTPFAIAADFAYDARIDCYSWEGCSQANPPSADEEMDKAVRWAMASALSTDQPVLTVILLMPQACSLMASQKCCAQMCEVCNKWTSRAIY